MKINLKKIIFTDFSSWWLPSAAYIILLVIFTVLRLFDRESLDYLTNSFFFLLLIALLGIFSAAIYHFFNKRWLKGIVNFLMLPICAVLTLFTMVLPPFFPPSDNLAERERAFLRPEIDWAKDASNDKMPEIHVPSPDKNWTVLAHWIKDRGYNWELRNEKTGKYYFRVDVKPNNVFAKHFFVKWSPDSNYFAETEYLDEKAELTSVVNVAGKEPEGIDLYKVDASNASPWLYETLVKPEDKRWGNVGYYQYRVRAEQWVNNTDLILVFYMETTLNSNSQRLLTAYHKTFHFDGNSFEIIDSKCDFYKKRRIFDD